MIAADAPRDDAAQPGWGWLSGNGIEILWTAAIALLFVVVGYRMLPGLIRMAGKSGRIETVEWSLFIALGIAFPAVAAAAGRLTTKLTSPRAAAVSAGAGLVVVCVASRFFWIMGLAALLISGFFAVLVLAVAVRSNRDRSYRWTSSWTVASALVLTAAWEAVFRLASWTDAAGWISQSPVTPVLTALIAIAATMSIAGKSSDSHRGTDPTFRISWIDVPAILLFLVLSFRTTPIVEFDHWSFWVGPIESVRQGAWLLRDVPSQYGFLTILLPSLLPTANAWEALYLFQGALFALAAIVIYAIVVGLRPGTASRIVALAFTGATLFFRPRSFPLILPAQMTPSGGPVRFFPCYAVLAVLVWRYRGGQKVSDRRFALVGTIVWVVSVAWSAESAIYTTVAWGGAYAVFLVQKFMAARALEVKSRRSASVQLLLGIALPLFAMITTVLIVTLIYVTFEGHTPDWVSYYEYAVLFSGGYGALPADVTGAVWYLFVLFISVSAGVVCFLARDASNPRLVVAAGAWGTVWAISSYFVSRSHPANILSLIPVLVLALMIVLHALDSVVPERWSRLLRMVAVPLVVMPTVLTLAHSGFPDLLLRQQDRMTALTVQVPVMDPSLYQLVRTSRMTSADPVFFVSDGRYVMPRWPELHDGLATTNAVTWMPKPYEIISTLPEARRDIYITRIQERLRRGGWLIQKKSEINPAYERLVSLIEKSFVAVRSVDNDQWIMVRYEPKGRL